MISEGKSFPKVIPGIPHFPRGICSRTHPYTFADRILYVSLNTYPRSEGGSPRIRDSGRVPRLSKRRTDFAEKTKARATRCAYDVNVFNTFCCRCQRFSWIIWGFKSVALLIFKKKCHIDIWNYKLVAHDNMTSCLRDNCWKFAYHN